MADNKKHIGFRIPPDTYEEFEEYRGDELSQTDAGRRLLERGLEVERGDRDPMAARSGMLVQWLVTVSAGLLLLALGAVLGLFGTGLPVVAVAGTLSFASVVLLALAARVAGTTLVEAAGERWS